MNRYKDQLKSIVQEWNRRNPIGTAVRFWPEIREGQGKTGLTTSEAYLLGGHTPVVLIDKASGCIALKHVEPLAHPREDGPSPMPLCPKCGRRRDVAGCAVSGFYCHLCQMEFDEKPDEGGDWDDRDPSRRLELAENRTGRRAMG